MICKFPDYMKQYSEKIGEIVIHLLGTEIRMEQTGLQITSAVFERIGIFSDQLLGKVLHSIFTSMHFYRNATRNKVIPVSIVKAIHIFFATFMISFGLKGWSKLVMEFNQTFYSWF